MTRHVADVFYEDLRKFLNERYKGIVHLEIGGYGSRPSHGVYPRDGRLTCPVVIDGKVKEEFAKEVAQTISDYTKFLLKSGEKLFDTCEVKVSQRNNEEYNRRYNVIACTLEASKRYDTTTNKEVPLREIGNLEQAEMDLSITFIPADNPFSRG